MCIHVYIYIYNNYIHAYIYIYIYIFDGPNSNSMLPRSPEVLAVKVRKRKAWWTWAAWWPSLTRRLERKRVKETASTWGESCFRAPPPKNIQQQIFNSLEDTKAKANKRAVVSCPFNRQAQKRVPKKTSPKVAQQMVLKMAPWYVEKAKVHPVVQRGYLSVRPT